VSRWCRFDVQTCSGKGSQASDRGDSGAPGGALRLGLSPRGGAGRYKPPVRDWHSVSESVREGFRDVQNMTSLGEEVSKPGSITVSDQVRNHYGTPALNERGKHLGETETWRAIYFEGPIQTSPSVIFTRPGETYDARLGISLRQDHRASCRQMILPRESLCNG
jgi:hypothetical protein